MITAVVLEGRSPAEVARTYGVARSWVYKLVARYRAEGDTAFEPRTRRPHSRPDATPTDTVELVLDLRHRLSAQGLDAGADTIAWHLEHHHQTRLSRATIYRIIRRAGLVTPEPAKKPRASYIRFQAEQPNETWQADFTHHRLADGTDIEILTWLDDHSRYALSITAHRPVTGPAVVATFTACIDAHGAPFSTLTDNGMVFTARFAQGGNTSRNGLEKLLQHLGIKQKNSRPNHPTTCGKVERFQQTMKRWLRAQPAPETIDELQALLDTFRHHYNHHRPHRSLPHRATPATAYNARPKATPAGRTDTDHRVRRDRVSHGNVSLRVNGELHHIGISRTLDRTPVILLIHDLDIRIIHAATGEILRTATINPHRRYHPSQPPTDTPKTQQTEP